jgi:putative sterol carrier protein
MAAGELDPARAMFDGTLVVEGDFAVAARLGDMFGQPPRF